jgi:hypothetical protein
MTTWSDLRASVVLSLRALRDAPVRTIVTLGLVSFSAVIVSCTATVTLGMSDAAQRAASADVADRAMLIRSHASPSGHRTWERSEVAAIEAGLAGTASVESRHWTHVSMRSLDDARRRGRSVPVACVNAAFPLETVRWVSPDAPREWRQAVSSEVILVLAGANVHPSTGADADVTLNTSAGRMRVVGRLRPVAAVTFDAQLNSALIVFASNPAVKRLCRGEARELLVRPSAGAGFENVLGAVEDVVRTEERLRPATPTSASFHIITDDLLRRLFAKLAETIGPWVLLAPLAISLICGIGAMAVNLVHSLERMHDFGVMRSVGATRRDLVLQLVVEAAMVAALAIVPPLLMVVTSGSDAHRGLAAVAFGFIVAAALSLVGVLIPGLYAAHASRIVGLERAGS